MGHVDERDPDLALDLLQLDLHLAAELQVERAERLVEEQHGGAVDECAGQGNALALAARELVRPVVCPLGQPDQLERIGDALLDLVLRPLLSLEPEGDVPRNVEMAEERVALEDHVHVPLVRRHVLDRLALEPDVALGGHLEAREHAKRRRLAAPRRPEQAEELALRDR